jgi:hypothetical protein
MTEFIGTALYTYNGYGAGEKFKVNLVRRKDDDSGWVFYYVPGQGRHSYETRDTDCHFTDIDLTTTVESAEYNYLLTAAGDFSNSFATKVEAIAAARTLRNYLKDIGSYHRAASVKVEGPPVVVTQREEIDF